MRASFILFLAAAWVMGPAARANEDPQARLDALQPKIEALQNALQKAHGRHSALERQLRDAELAIAEGSATLADLGRQIRQGEKSLADLEMEAATHRQALAQHRQALSRQLRAAYLSGRQPFLKVLLNQTDPTRIGRGLTYYDYFNRARAEGVATAREHIAAVEQASRKIERENARLAQRREQRRAAQGQMASQQDKRRRLLAALQRDIGDKKSALERLLADQRRLEDLVGSLGTIETRPIQKGAERFASSQGELRWPVRGRISADYGAPRANGQLRWRGVMLKAARGSQVQAVAAGRVVFADWMRGYGLLLIVDHGDGYMSLYGHNERLEKRVGDPVQAGQVVARVGDSGGRDEPGLYFEIRHKGKPTNPRTWLAAKGP